MTDNLVYYAGKSALAEIRENGVSPDRISTIAGAAGGPKWLALYAMDRALFSNWFQNRTHPLALVGSSIGAWRFAAIARKNPLEGLAKFLEAYLFQQYSMNPDADEISGECVRVLNRYVTDTDIDAILNHPYIWLSVLTVRSKTLIASAIKPVLTAGLIGTFIANTLSRKNLRFFAERGLFYDTRTPPGILKMNDFQMHRIALTKDNFRQAILASGAIPLFMNGIRDIPGAPKGIYRDGGIIDYHLDIDFSRQDGIVLFPHFAPRIIPGWLDKTLPNRKPTASHMKNVLLIAPSPAFTETLPLKRVPDRRDFEIFNGDDAGRIACWKTALAQCQPLGEELMETLESGKIKDRVMPLDTNG